MSYQKTSWLDRSDPAFDSGTSPEVDADNLNKIEDGIASINDAINNLSSSYGQIESNLQQQVFTSETDLTWDLITQSNDLNIFEFNDINNTFTIKKAGTFNFNTYTTYGIGTNVSILITTSIVDSVLGTVWQTSSKVVSGSIGETYSVVENKSLVFSSGDLPKTLKIIHSANGNNMYINSISYTLNTLISGADGNDHSALTGRNDTDSHPITAITDLHTTLNGNIIVGEAI